MSSNLGTKLENAFLCYFKQICHDECHKESVDYRIYANEIFLLFQFKDNVLKDEFKKVMAHLFF